MPAGDYKKTSLHHAPVSRRHRLLFLLLLLGILILLLLVKKSRGPGVESLPWETTTLPVLSTPWSRLTQQMQEGGFKAWQYHQVQQFMEHLTPIVLSESLKTGVPPAALLAIAALESGYDTGYIANVTGNILALNAKPGEVMLPPLEVPVKDATVIIDPVRLKALLATGDPVPFEARPPSLKKDYRPEPLGGTTQGLNYFQQHPTEKYLAWHQNVQDLVYGRLRPDSPIPVYRATFDYCERIKKNGSLRALFKTDTATRFLDMIGGRPLSYNVRPSWRIKTQDLVIRLGLENFLIEYLHLYREDYALEDWEWDLPEPATAAVVS